MARTFAAFKEETGLLTDSRVTESVALSPFDCRQNYLLYMFRTSPHEKNGIYYDKLAAEIKDARPFFKHGLIAGPAMESAEALRKFSHCVLDAQRLPIHHSEATLRLLLEKIPVMKKDAVIADLVGVKARLAAEAGPDLRRRDP